MEVPLQGFRTNQTPFWKPDSSECKQKVPSGHMTFIQRRLNVDATQWRCIDVEATLFYRHVPTGCWVLIAVPSAPCVTDIHEHTLDSHLSRNSAFPTKLYAQPAKIQISLCISAVCLVFAVGFRTLWVLGYPQLPAKTLTTLYRCEEQLCIDSIT